MVANVYRFPPVKMLGHVWTEDTPVSVSRSLISGKRYVSSSQRTRRNAELVVSALSGERSGAGYMEVLKSLLQGGQHLVRLTSVPTNWHIDERRMKAFRTSAPVDWQDGAAELDWSEAGVDLMMFTGQYLTAVPALDGPWPAAMVTGLPSNTLVARPGEYLTVFADHEDLIGEAVRVLAQASSDPAGQARYA